MNTVQYIKSTAVYCRSKISFAMSRAFSFKYIFR